jgi:hypothetical protein
MLEYAGEGEKLIILGRNLISKGSIMTKVLITFGGLR